MKNTERRNRECDRKEERGKGKVGERREGESIRETKREKQRERETDRAGERERGSGEKHQIERKREVETEKEIEGVIKKEVAARCV